MGVFAQCIEHIGDVVYFVGGMGAFDRPELLEGFNEKFKSEPIANGDQFLLGQGNTNRRIAGPCFVRLGTMLQGNWVDEAGKVPNLRELAPKAGDPKFNGPASMACPGLQVLDLNQASQFRVCGPSVIAYMPELGGRVGEFAVWLTDTAEHTKALTGLPIRRGGSEQGRSRL